MKLPETNSCCFYCPLRWGIIFFGYVNMISSLLAAFCLALTIELHRRTVWTWDCREIASAFSFAIFGMSVILSILLLFAAYEKDKKLLLLYNAYAVANTLAAMALTVLLLFIQDDYKPAVAALFAIATQCYVFILVRSEALLLERQSKRNDAPPPVEDGPVDISEEDNLV